MSARYELPIDLELGPGPVAAGLATTGLAVASAASAAIPGPWRALCLALLLGAAVELGRWLGQSGRRLEWRGWGELWIVDRHGHRQPARLGPVQYAAPWCVRLELEAAGRRERHVIWRVEQADPVRRLLQRLRAGRWRERPPE